MITPRRTRLHRVPTLRRYHRVLASLTRHEDPFTVRSCAVIVPSRAAAVQLRHTLETLAVSDRRRPAGADLALAFPDLVTRADWYARLGDRLPDAPPLLNDFDREVLMDAAAREAIAGGAAPPFKLRPGLIAEIVRLYDELHRLEKTVRRFDELLTEDLTADAGSDRGAARLLAQTRFLVRAFQAYEARLDDPPRLDEHRLRPWLLAHPLPAPYTQVVLAVADRTAEREGLWPADFDLLTRLPQLARIDVVATEGMLAAGFHERVHQLLPGLEESWGEVDADAADGANVANAADDADEDGAPAVLVAPAGATGPYGRSRDREDELSDVARALKTPRDDRATLGRTAVVFRRPLPYVYLARQVFGGAGIPYQLLDALPLAAEPYASAVDLVFEFVSSEFSRASIVALLRSPQFVFGAAGRPPGRRAAAGLDRRLAESGYLAGLDELRALVARWSAPEAPGAPPAFVRDAAGTALALAEELAPLSAPAPASRQLDLLSGFLRRHDRPVATDDPLRERHLRARAAIHAAFQRLAAARRTLDDRTSSLGDVVAGVRRWIEAQTFAPREGADGVHLADAQAARFGTFDEVYLVGLIDTDWPDRSPRNIFYPPFLLQQLGWPAETNRLLAARAAFRDLVGLARRRTTVSTFSLEDDAIVGPSVYLDDLEGAGMTVERVPPGVRARVFPDEALSEDPVSAAPLAPEATAWLALRRSRTDAGVPEFHGSAGGVRRPSYSVGSLETYLECPFKYFAKHVLRLEEEQDDDEARRPRIQGIFLHRVFQTFYEAWGGAGRRGITLDTVAEARSLFAEVVVPLLDELPEAEAALQRTRLFGSAAAEGLAEIVFRVEAESGTEVVERLLEYHLEGEFDIDGSAGTRRVPLTGVADRIDLLADGTVRVIDYKAGRPPSPKRMLQIPIYTLCAARQLEGRHGRSWEPGDGGYIAFRDARRFVALGGDRGAIGPALTEAQERLIQALDGIEAGQFPPAPLEPFRCTWCSYSGVCRKDYVGDD